MLFRRVVYVVATLATIALGIASRRFAGALPAFVATYAGDALWALAVYFVIAAIAPRWPAPGIAVAALLIGAGVEVLQLYQGEPLGSLRRTALGGLVLGHGFLWSDLFLYAVGAAAGMAADRWRRPESANRPPS